MTTSAQQHNLQELIVALQGNDGVKLSHELIELLKAGLHHAHMPDTLKVSAAEMLQLTVEGVGGLPRMLLWGDRNYNQLMKLYARQTSATIGPVLPPPRETTFEQEWPEWMTARRLAYQEAPQVPTQESSDDEDTQ